MIRRVLPPGVALVALAALMPAEQQTPAARVATFKAPPGFVVEPVAGPPLVQHPMFACFDEDGRLYVADAAGVNLRAPELLKETPNRIVRLEDTDGDGDFDKSVVFADNLTLPMGVLWHEGAVYTASPPSFWKLEDTDGDGRADRRTEIVTKFGFTGNAADVHGPFLSPDGRLYWCDGRHGHEIERDGKTMKGKAARIFRCRPDGSEVEVVCGGGMDNPVEVAFTAEGDPIATANIMMTRPRVDTLFHCVDGGVWPYHEVINEFPRTGDLLPPVYELGWVAPSGLMRYRSAALGKQYRDNLFSAQFNRHRIQRHVLTRDGATLRATGEDFLVSEDADVHLTDVLEDADGSLLVVDTGGWFRIGCPTSQIAKPEIKGAIYRVRRKDAPAVNDPRGRRVPWTRWTAAEFVGLLDDPRPAVRDRAIRTLAGLGDRSVVRLRDSLTGKHSTMRHRNAVWALTRIGSTEAKTALRAALSDADASVRQSAVRGLGLVRDTGAIPELRKVVVEDADAAIRREAATALGRMPQPESVPVLVEALARGADRFLEHAILYALIRTDHRAGVLKALTHENSGVRRGALIVLDQSPGGGLTQDLVIRFLTDEDESLQRAALEIVGRRPEWAGEVVGLLRRWLTEGGSDARRVETLRSILLSLGRTEAVQSLLAEVLSRGNAPAASRIVVLETMTRSPQPKLPAGWQEALRKALTAKEESVLLQAVAAVEANRIEALDGALLGLARDRNCAGVVRVAALSAAGPRMPRVDAVLVEFLTARLAPDVPPLDRLGAAQALARLPLDLTQLEALTGAVAVAGPLELPHLLGAFEGKNNPAVGRKLVAALRESKAVESLSAEAVRRVVQSYPAEVRQGTTALILRLEASIAQQRGRLKQLEPLLAEGDVRRGRDIFFGKKAACAACHRVRTDGEATGPDLTTIGAIRPARDLLESVIFPSASFVRGYEPYLVTTKSGKVHTGILVREGAEAITLLTAERAEVSIARADIEGFEPGRISVMPQGLDTQLTRDELRDLLGFLQSLR